eukprot:3732755-Karenia_brevis.AAC.1
MPPLCASRGQDTRSETYRSRRFMQSSAAEVGLDVNEQSSIEKWCGNVSDQSSLLTMVLGPMAVRYSDKRAQLAAQSRMKILHSLSHAAAEVGPFE